jgi:SAM-dependent methyltransferase
MPCAVGEGTAVDFYSGWWARHYDLLWRHFTRRTLAQALRQVDFAALRAVPDRQWRTPRVLDVGCGTGMLLGELLRRVPRIAAQGVDASADMLAHARKALAGRSNIHLERATLGPGATAGLPFAPGTFDLIVCTNTLHAIGEPVVALAGLARLLAPGGQLVLEDYARRGAPFPWHSFEELVRRVDTTHVRVYTREEACELCGAAGLRVIQAAGFPVDWLWHAWALRATAEL